MHCNRITIVAIIAAGFIRPVVADVTLISQDRFVDAEACTDVFGTQMCNSDSDQATDFGPFDGFAYPHRSRQFAPVQSPRIDIATGP